ncbi:hypothetical protein HYH03_018604 [Edaphochlamys debaryana]|uniref:Uncharacterized protein n=1 Tax=Edaphochlamys debaryana TaxID=47281 RepID=A0A835XLK9_9CHLO|nr:hypothetical protein HYH03_018598 [Edaphochlamys debaryana]KAG2482471.1 hypothetical protein HYH03_018604 [Edaphochlamys debaryana]|eukprot:KAG2482464.1 hypothetical protein HYH03_018598 [Edaphochlamys debaryana]
MDPIVSGPTGNSTLEHSIEWWAGRTPAQITRRSLSNVTERRLEGFDLYAVGRWQYGDRFQRLLEGARNNANSWKAKLCDGAVVGFDLSEYVRQHAADYRRRHGLPAHAFVYAKCEDWSDSHSWKVWARY